MRSWVAACFALTTLSLSTACGSGTKQPNFSSEGQETTETADGTGGNGCGECLGNDFVQCDGDGNPVDPLPCNADYCLDQVGCVPCAPGTIDCVDNNAVECGMDGQPGDVVETCDSAAGEVCAEGGCKAACDAASLDASNVGCEFWSVDLPNARGLDSAWENPWGVVLTNAGNETASVVIERNLAAPGEPQSTFVVANVEIPVGELRRIELPQAEVTGWNMSTMEPPGPPGTQLSSNAFRIRSTAPLVVYQFNNFINDFSTDASLLLPVSGLGNSYRVIGYPTANPIAVPGLTPPGIPDRSAVTVVGVAPNTSVTVRTSHKTKSDMVAIPVLEPGGSYTTTLGAFDVLNISSDGIPGDMTGTVVEASAPVVVFTSGERGIGPAITSPPEPPGWDGDNCCTDHLEEQLFPITSLGQNFVVSRSPLRSTGGYKEPDELRFLGVAAPAQVTTNLPPPLDSFTLNPGQVVDTFTTEDVVVESSEPIMIGQILVSQGFTTRVIGDPSLTIFAPVEQYRESYIFLTPDTWSENYVVLSAPVGGTFALDGQALPSDCTTASAGTLQGVAYETITCPVGEGPHTLESGSGEGSDATPFGMMAYGYGSAGSYAFAGGADVEAIYNPPPIP